MGCGCGGQQAESRERRTESAIVAAPRGGRGGAVTPEVVQARAAMCDACLWCVRSSERPANLSGQARSTLCGATRVPLVVHLQVLGCPLEKFGGDQPDVMRWGGVAWYGLPKPLRWRAMLRIGKRRDYPGCGCMVVAKESWWGRLAAPVLERVFVAVDGAVHRAGAWWHSQYDVVNLPMHAPPGDANAHLAGGMMRVERADWSPIGTPLRGAVAWAGLVMMAVLCLVGACV